MHVEFDKAIDLDHNTEWTAITYANVLLTWAVSNPVCVVYMYRLYYTKVQVSTIFTQWISLCTDILQISSSEKKIKA